jgi:class 3 adenylate cyclase/putative methionine-R-sulfoxide reductase with GAF domain
MLRSVSPARHKVPPRKPPPRDRELAEARDQLRATSEILRMIADSQSDVQPVFDTIVRSAVSLCDSLFANVFRFDGELLHFAASHNVGPSYVDLLQQKYPMRPDRSQVAGRVLLTRSVVRLDDVLADPDYDRRFPATLSWRRMLGVPLLRDGNPLGAIVVGWAEAGPVPQAQEQLLRTFADQAVIAIENVRLFQELEARNRELAEALEQQTATSEILRVISSSPTDATPVFQTIVENAARLCHANFAAALLYERERLRSAAHTTVTPEFAEYFRKGYPVDRTTTTGRAALERKTVQVADVLNDPEFVPTPAHRNEGVRTVLAAPMLRDGALLGIITTWRVELRAFTDQEVRLLQTFADQAVIAIGNVRLFQELQLAGRRLEAQAAELAQWNATLEQRVQEQVNQLERLARLKRFFSPQLADLIVAGGAEDPLRSHRREITVVFLDLRGFTAFAETAEPEEVMAVLHEYHTAMGELILRHEGTLERFTGDGMMVFFNDPVPCDEPARRAVSLALGMRDRAAVLSDSWKRRGHDLRLGVGIATGYATCGQVGFEGRYEYAAIGTVTNLAARLCSEAKGGQVLISQRVFTMLDGAAHAEHLGDIEFKGIAQPVPTYVVQRLSE